MIHVSELACTALGMKPEGSRHTQGAGHCALCARPIANGDLSSATKVALGRGFTDYGYLVAGAEWVCGFCMAINSSLEAQKLLQKCVITAEGVYPLDKDQYRAWFWLSPPATPFVVTINNSITAKLNQFWQATATLDQRLIAINVDGVAYQVSRPRLEKALEVAAYLVQQHDQVDRKKERMPSPFCVLHRGPSRETDASHGHLRAGAVKLAEGNERAKEGIEFLSRLKPGELIALSSLLKQNPKPPVKPEIVTQLGEPKPSQKQKVSAKESVASPEASV